MKSTFAINDTKEIVIAFAKAVQKKDFDLIASLLAGDGKFNTQDAELNTIDDCNKEQFIDWFKNHIASKEITKIEYDNCIMCKMGNPVVLFNEGLLVLQPEGSEKSRTGFMLDVFDGQIMELAFCFYFAQRENKSQMEYDMIEVKKLTAQGVPKMQAIEIVLKARGCKDIWK